MFKFIEYNNEQRKTYSNTELVYKIYLELFHRYNKSYRYKMGWNKSNGNEYLYKECYDTRRDHCTT